MRDRVLFVTGPTSSGKTALGLALAERLGGEVVNADARQLYRDAPVGTGVPGGAWEDRGGRQTYVVQGIPHHLMAVSPPEEAWTAARWVEAAKGCLDEIWARGGLPIVVGGTGLYVRALSEGFAFSGPPDPAVRERLLALTPEARLEALRGLDPRIEAKVDIRNPHRVLRALERAMSEQPAPSVRPPAFQSLKLARSRPADALRSRVGETVRRQLAGGWIDEVRALLERGVPADAPLLTSIGFRAIAAALAVGDPSVDGLFPAVERETWAYVRRQMTWFRKEPGLTWVGSEAEALDRAEAWISQQAA